MEETNQVLDQSKRFAEYFENQYEKVNYWLSFAEAKNGALIAVNVALISSIFSSLKTISFLCATTIVLLIFSSVVCLSSFIPNLKNGIVEKEIKTTDNVNLIFYGDICKIGNVSRYIELVKDKYFEHENVGVNDKFVFDLATEIMINSEITVRKYNKFKIALKIDILALLIIIISILIA